MDSILECNAPFYGEIVTIDEPLAWYRLHDSNLYAMNTFERAHFTMMLQTFEGKLDYLAGRCRKWGVRFDPAVARNRSSFLLECRLVTAKLAPANDLSREPILKILYYGLKAHIGGTVPRMVQIIRAVWFLIVALGPDG